MESILVLNNDYTPINVTGLNRAFKLVYLGKAEVVESNDDKPIITSVKIFKRPTIIRLLNYITVPFRKVTLNRENIFKRDGYHCLYCGDKDRDKLTIDHVIPKSKGGKNTWKNLATCCRSCNVEKDNKTLEEADLKLEYQPYRPTYLQFVKNINVNGGKNWLPYLFS